MTQRHSLKIIDVPKLLANQVYDEAAFSSMPEWAEELAKAANNDDGEQQSEADEYGIAHFSIRELGRPFHPERWCVQYARTSTLVRF